MATINGKVTVTNGIPNFNFDDLLFGTGSDDSISGLDGNDIIYAGAGNDTVHGGGGNDSIYAPSSQSAFGSPAAWGTDTIYGDSGNDWISFATTTSNVTLYGDGTSLTAGDGNDTLIAGSGSDRLYGGGGNDTLYGGAGTDTLYGDIQSGNIPGAGGSDILVGGAGYDNLYGGIGDDKFVYNRGDSNPTYSGADVIWDFNDLHDKIQIVGGPAVTSDNYIELKLLGSSGSSATDFANAAKAADAYLDVWDYAFLTNGTQGYLFADVNHDGSPDFGIELKGLTSVNDFSQFNLLT